MSASERSAAALFASSLSTFGVTSHGFGKLARLAKQMRVDKQHAGMRLLLDLLVDVLQQECRRVVLVIEIPQQVQHATILGLLHKHVQILARQPRILLGPWRLRMQRRQGQLQCRRAKNARSPRSSAAEIHRAMIRSAPRNAASDFTSLCSSGIHGSRRTRPRPAFVVTCYAPLHFRLLSLRRCRLCWPPIGPLIVAMRPAAATRRRQSPINSASAGPSGPVAHPSPRGQPRSAWSLT